METKRGEAVKSILKILLAAGLVAVACASPRFSGTLVARVLRSEERKNKFSGKDKKKYYNAFYYLKRNKLINIKYRGNQMYFSLTDEGKKKAGRYKIDELEIKKQKKWDKKWRVLIFDIQDIHKAKREALRGKLKELGLFQLQKSVWVCPYEFKKEMRLLRDFFGLDSGEMKIISAFEIEEDETVRKHFNLK
jgi:CRISPR-associated endonuclease Cas2